MEKRKYYQVFCDDIRLSNKVTTELKLTPLQAFSKHLTKT